ncbi:hypothetical protein V499_04191 [Pseudogymnoascus sp. VKM F-103]|nr:hypothetical protein V499_04191 [Pseudogymnoascus sp. VKM F-103]
MLASVSNILVASLFATTVVGSSVHRPENGNHGGDAVDAISAKGLAKLKAWTKSNPPAGNCTLENAVIRREWSAFSRQERLDYIDAVLCLQKKPPTTPLSIIPGVRSRYDDFVGTHINQTLFIHSTGNFLGWHRYYVWTYEQALRNDCNYQGHQPYWNWGKYALDPVNSLLFDGSDESLSGDGSYFEHTPVAVAGAPPPFDVIIPGKGGGCVTSGPFKDMVVSLGPVAGTLDGVTPNPTPDGYSYNPRCLRRDISENAAVSTRTNATVSLLTTRDNISDFQDYMQGVFAEGILGVHAGGHFTVGGDPGGDFFASAGDPAFWLHHASVDRIWWIWQNQDLATRQNAIAGQTHMAGDGVPTTLEDDQFFQVNGKVPKLKDLLTTLGAFGPPFLLRGERFEDGGERGSTLLAFIHRGASRFCSAVPSYGSISNSGCLPASLRLTRSLNQALRYEHRRAGSPPPKNLHGYTPAIDIWAMGMILHKLLGGEFQQINDIWYAEEREFSRAKRPAARLAVKMLAIDPEQRPTATECLRDPWLAIAGNKPEQAPEKRVRSISPVTRSKAQPRKRAQMTVLGSETWHSGAGLPTTKAQKSNYRDGAIPLGATRQMEDLASAHQQAHGRNESGPNDITMILNWQNDQSLLASGLCKLVITSNGSDSIVFTLGLNVWQMDICTRPLVPNDDASHISASAHVYNDVTMNDAESIQRVINRILEALETNDFYNSRFQQNELVQYSTYAPRQAIPSSWNDPAATITNTNKTSNHQNTALPEEDVLGGGPSESPEWVIELVNRIFVRLDDCYSALYYWKEPVQDTHGSIMYHPASDPFFPQPSLSAAMKLRVQSGTDSKQGDSSGQSKQSDSSGKSSSDNSSWNRTTLPLTLSLYDDRAGY